MRLNNQKVTNVATKKELYNEHYYRRLWLVARNIKLGRRKWLDEISLTFFRYRGKILNSDSTEFVMPEIDDLFPDQEMRWLSHYMEADYSGMNPRRISRQWQRVQLIDLYIRIKYSKLAHHIAR